jgi:hypothetical protein
MPVIESSSRQSRFQVLHGAADQFPLLCLQKKELQLLGAPNPSKKIDRSVVVRSEVSIVELIDGYGGKGLRYAVVIPNCDPKD